MPRSLTWQVAEREFGLSENFDSEYSHNSIAHWQHQYFFISNTILLPNLPTRSSHMATSNPEWKCTLGGCSRSFKNRKGLKSHTRLVHSLPHQERDQHPPHTPNTRHNLQPHIAPLSPSFPPISPIGSSSSESNLHSDASRSNSPINSQIDASDCEAMNVDQPPPPSPAGTGSSSASSSSMDQDQVRPESVTRSYHPIINGTFFNSCWTILNYSKVFLRHTLRQGRQ